MYTMSLKYNLEIQEFKRKRIWNKLAVPNCELMNQCVDVGFTFLKF